MNQIEITHNPFTVDTQFLINGQAPAEGCKLSSYKESRLQVWVESLFDELFALFNGDNNLKVRFKGVESDYLDVQAASNEANEKGGRTKVEWVPAEPTETRLEKIRDLIKEAKEHPRFDLYLHGNEKVKDSLDEAFNRDFDVYVVATMSAGKSTLINAMLGRDLLPAANEATTATIARIMDNDQMAGRFSALRIDEQGSILDSSENISLETLQQWNQTKDTFRIDIEGNIVAIKERDNVRLVLTDTPGPNNSQNEEHERTTMGFIQDSRRNPLILYILNGTQLSTKDDRNLLGLVAREMSKGGKQSKDRFIFVVNKMDAFDPEKGENPLIALSNVRQYLESNGIHNPLVYPVSAYLTGLIRKPQDKHSRKERGDFSGLADLFGEEQCMNLLQYMPITSRVKRALAEKEYSDLMLSSGLPAVEAMIDEYIDKYNLPHRLKRAYDALLRAIEVGLNEVNLIEGLDQDERVLSQINHEIQDLNKRKEKGFDVQAYKDKVAREGKSLPESTKQILVRLEAENKAFFAKIAKRFEGTEKPTKAERMAREAEEDLKSHFQQLINEYEKAFFSSQEAIRQDLESDYHTYVTELFEECRHLNLPTLAGIEQAVADMSLSLVVGREDIEIRRVKAGSYEVSTGKWWNPFSWGRTETRYNYVDEEFIDLEKFWQEHEVSIRMEFTELQNSARKNIEQKKDDLIEHFLTFMNREFDEKFDELIASIQNKLNDRGERERAIEEAKQQLDWINAFKTKLDQILAI